MPDNFLGNRNATLGGSVTIPVAASGGSALNAANGSVFSLTPTASQTLTASVVPAGYEMTLIVITSGTTSYTQTFGTGFKSTGTLATGTTSGATFVLRFISNGTNMIEVSRTAAIT